MSLSTRNIQKQVKVSQCHLLLLRLNQNSLAHHAPQVSHHNRTYSYETLCKAAYTAEATMMSKYINDDSKVNAVIAGMSLHEKQQDREIAMTREELAGSFSCKDHLSVIDRRNRFLFNN